jgi:hypothetical protein
MGTPNWGVLYAQGRCKQVGIPWTEEEAYAVFTLRIPAEYVRRGAVTPEAFEAMKADDQAHLQAEGELPLKAMPKEDLVEKAGALGIEVTKDATKEALVDVIEKKPVAKKKKK